MTPLLPHLSMTPDAALLLLETGQTLILRTPMQARQLGDLCRAAEQQLTEQQHERAARLDREAAAEMNAASAAALKAWGAVLQTWPPVPERKVTPIRIVACSCDFTDHCTCGGAA